MALTALRATAWTAEMPETSLELSSDRTATSSQALGDRREAAECDGWLFSK